MEDEKDPLIVITKKDGTIDLAIRISQIGSLQPRTWDAKGGTNVRQMVKNGLLDSGSLLVFPVEMDIKDIAQLISDADRGTT